MNWRKVESSNLNRVRYFPVTQLLIVEFKDKKTGRPTSIYAYGGVPAWRYYALLRAPSKGTYHNRFIAYKYQYQFVDRVRARSLGLITA